MRSHIYLKIWTASAVFSLCGLCGLAKNKTYSAVFRSGYSDARITNIIRSDTATVVELQSVQYPGDEFWMPDVPLYLCDEHLRRFPLKYMQGISIGKNLYPLSGVLDFSLTFEALPKESKVFDLLSAYNEATPFTFWGIHADGHRLGTFKRIPEGLCFRKEYVLDSSDVKVRGRIEDYVQGTRKDTFSFSITVVAHYDDRTRERRSEASVSAEGEFELDIPIENTTWAYIEGRGVIIPIFLTPGDTIDVSIKNLRAYNMEVGYTSSKGYDVMSRLMSADPRFFDYDLFYSGKSKVRLSEINKEVSSRKKKRDEFCSYLAWKYQLTDFESHLLQLYMRSTVDVLYMSYVNKGVRETFMHERGSYSPKWLAELSGHPEIVQSYSFLQGINVKDYSYFVLPKQWLVGQLGQITSATFKLKREDRLRTLEEYLKREFDEEWKKRIWF